MRGESAAGSLDTERQAGAKPTSTMNENDAPFEGAVSTSRFRPTVTRLTPAKASGRLFAMLAETYHAAKMEQAQRGACGGIRDTLLVCGKPSPRHEP